MARVTNGLFFFFLLFHVPRRSHGQIWVRKTAILSNADTQYRARLARRERGGDWMLMQRRGLCWKVLKLSCSHETFEMDLGDDPPQPTAPPNSTTPKPYLRFPHIGGRPAAGGETEKKKKRSTAGVSAVLPRECGLPPLRYDLVLNGSETGGAWKYNQVSQG